MYGELISSTPEEVPSSPSTPKPATTWAEGWRQSAAYHANTASPPATPKAPQPNHSAQALPSTPPVTRGT